MQTDSIPLAQLKEIVDPESVGFMPQTVGWLILFILLVALMSWWALRRYRRWQANQYRRDALAELEVLREQMLQADQPAVALSSLAVLVKRTALHSFPREKVAALTGRDWLQFLTDSSTGMTFDGKTGSLLAELEYAPPEFIETECSKEDVGELTRSLKDWIEHHQAPRMRREVKRA
jgi:hypothetical protein